MSEVIKQHYIVDGTDFTRAGEASGKIKKTLKDIGFPPQAVRNTAIAVYEALRQDGFDGFDTNGESR